MSKENAHTPFHTKERVWEGFLIVCLSRRVRDAMNRENIFLERKIKAIQCFKNKDPCV